MARFPADIETEILLRLPVKTLKCFKCVCKSWHSLISSTQFQKSHFSHSQNKPPLLLTIRHEEPNETFECRHSAYSNANNHIGPLEYYKSTGFDPFTIRLSTYDKEGILVKKYSITLPQIFSNNSLIGKPFMQSCMGLVLLASWGRPLILICNPCMEEVISLPRTGEVNLCVGIGYIPSTEEFKVVRFFYGNDKYCCEVFTLGSSRWREAKTPPFDVYRGCAPFLHGALHFLPRMEYSVRAKDYIAAFDIESEDYNKGIPLPDYCQSMWDNQDMANCYDFVRLTKLGGSLCLTLDFVEMTGRLEMWILKDYHNVQWVRGHTIDISPGYCLWAYPGETMGDADECILINLFDEDGIKLLNYYPRDKIVTLKIDKETAGTYYFESLYSVHGQVSCNLHEDC